MAHQALREVHDGMVAHASRCDSRIVGMAWLVGAAAACALAFGLFFVVVQRGGDTGTSRSKVRRLDGE